MIEIIGEPHRPNRLNLIIHKGRQSQVIVVKLVASRLHHFIADCQRDREYHHPWPHRCIHHYIKNKGDYVAWHRSSDVLSVPSACETAIKYKGATGTHKIHSGSVEGVNLENLALDTIHAIVWNLTTCLALPIQIIA